MAEILRREPVSYTHLDVYKRQHHNMAIFCAQTDDPVLSVEIIPIGRVTSDLSVFEDLSGHTEVTFSLAEE